MAGHERRTNQDNSVVCHPQEQKLQRAQWQSQNGEGERGDVATTLRSDVSACAEKSMLAADIDVASQDHQQAEPAAADAAFAGASEDTSAACMAIPETKLSALPQDQGVLEISAVSIAAVASPPKASSDLKPQTLALLEGCDDATTPKPFLLDMPPPSILPRQLRIKSKLVFFPSRSGSVFCYVSL